MKATNVFFIVAIAALALLACQSDDVLIAPTNDVIELRDNAVDYIALEGFQPEGIVLGKGNTAYVGGLFLGSILEVDLKTGEYETLVEGTPGMPTVGLSYDDRSGFIFAAGGNSGAVRVFNSKTGAMEGLYQLVVPTTPFDVWLNDLVVTREAVYVTNSLSQSLYKIPLGPAGQIPGMDAVEEIPFTCEWVEETEPTPGLPVSLNANGIDATPNGNMLVVANYAGNAIYTVDPETGCAELIEIPGPVIAPDGLLLKPCMYDDGYFLYAVYGPNAILKVKLDAYLEFESVLDVITDPDFQIPTTIAIKGDGLYAVNAKFDEYSPFEPQPDAEFSIVRVDK